MPISELGVPVYSSLVSSAHRSDKALKERMFHFRNGSLLEITLQSLGLKHQEPIYFCLVFSLAISCLCTSTVLGNQVGIRIQWYPSNCGMNFVAYLFIMKSRQGLIFS